MFTAFDLPFFDIALIVFKDVMNLVEIFFNKLNFDIHSNSLVETHSSIPRNPKNSKTCSNGHRCGKRAGSKKSKTKYRDANTRERENRMKAAWEGGRWVCVPLLQEKRGEKGKRGERVEEWYAPMSHAVGVKGDSSRVRPDSA